jgi:hypothetical protein
VIDRKYQTEAVYRISAPPTACRTSRAQFNACETPHRCRQFRGELTGLVVFLRRRGANNQQEREHA